MSTEEQAAQAIPAEVHMISGCKDEQTSADVSNVASFQVFMAWVLISCCVSPDPISVSSV